MVAETFPVVLSQCLSKRTLTSKCVMAAEVLCGEAHIQRLIIVRIIRLLKELIVVRIERRGSSSMAAAVCKYGLSPFVLYQGVHEHLHKLTLFVRRTAGLALVTRNLVTRIEL